ncbi:hypothetical protein VCR1J2_200333 [Vibrio coralliirubri]|nr:hypothetical protein VCR1J2_200333 [Vibrio coralliirubri]
MITKSVEIVKAIDFVWVNCKRMRGKGLHINLLPISFETTIRCRDV